MKLSPEHHEELKNLASGISLSKVKDAIPSLVEGATSSRDIIWAYYYPLTLRRALEYFEDEEDARNATVAFMQHWLKVIIIHNVLKGSLSAFYDRVRLNYFISYHERQVKPQPDIFNVAYDREEEEEEDVGDTDTDKHLDLRGWFERIYDYPYSGYDKGVDHNLDIPKLALAVRENLFPSDQEVFDLLVDGYNNKEIAAITGKSATKINDSEYRIRLSAREIYGY